MLVAQHPDQFFPLRRGSETGFLLARIHLEQQCWAIQVARIAGRSDHIGWEGSSLNDIGHEPPVGFQASSVARVIAENEQDDIFLTVRTAMDGGGYLPGRAKRQVVFLLDSSIFFQETIKRGECLHISLSQAVTSSFPGFLHGR